MGEDIPVIEDLVVTVLEEEPKLSELVEGKYNAVIKKENEKYVIETIKGESFKQSLEKVLNGGVSVKKAFASKEQRGVIGNLIGFLTMLILLLGSMLYKFCYQEKNGIDKRIVVSKVGYIKYTLSHPAVVFLILFIPTWTITVFANLVFGLNTSVSIAELTFILFTLCLLAASFSFCIASFNRSEQNGSLISTMAILITSIMSGSFIEISKGGITNRISHMFPQRYLLDYAIAIEHEWQASTASMVIIILLCIGMIVLGGWVNKKRIVS